MCLFLTDVISIPKTNENFRLLYDTKGRFRIHSIRDEEAKVILFNSLKYIFLYISIGMMWFKSSERVNLVYSNFEWFNIKELSAYGSVMPHMVLCEEISY